ncbi:hypothetical protein Hanom_Chr03g00233311 [Helianthus anomalus]
MNLRPISGSLLTSLHTLSKIIKKSRTITNNLNPSSFPEFP